MIIDVVKITISIQHIQLIFLKVFICAAWKLKSVLKRIYTLISGRPKLQFQNVYFFGSNKSKSKDILNSDFSNPEFWFESVYLFSRCDGHEGRNLFSGRLDQLLDAIPNHRIVLAEPHRPTSSRVVELRDVRVRVEIAVFAAAVELGSKASDRRLGKLDAQSLAEVNHSFLEKVRDEMFYFVSRMDGKCLLSFILQFIISN